MARAPAALAAGGVVMWYLSEYTCKGLALLLLEGSGGAGWSTDRKGVVVQEHLFLGWGKENAAIHGHLQIEDAACLSPAAGSLRLMSKRGVLQDSQSPFVFVGSAICPRPSCYVQLLKALLSSVTVFNLRSLLHKFLTRSSALCTGPSRSNGDRSVFLSSDGERRIYLHGGFQVQGTRSFAS